MRKYYRFVFFTTVAFCFSCSQSGNEIDSPPSAATQIWNIPERGACTYVNIFSGNRECRGYVGEGWTQTGAEADCATPFAGRDSVFAWDQPCAIPAVLGECRVETDPSFAVRVHLGGTRADGCTIARNACTSFLSGTFVPSSVCETASGPPTPPSQRTVFQPMTRTCQPSKDTVPGATDGNVCTWNGISGSTEFGRLYEDYGDCAIVRTQRPYYPREVQPITPPQADPRLSDLAYMADVAWTKRQVEASACVCCHKGSITPSGASGWDTEKGPIWFDTLEDDGLAMMAGLSKSDTFGAFDANDNNGFDRSITGVPTTDIERMQRILVAEYLRRGKTLNDAANVPEFGGPFVGQRDYVPTRCTPSEGIRDGKLIWGGGPARYVYVLKAGSPNPGVPPNRDLPVGTMWRVDVPPTADPVPTGLTYGSVAAPLVQKFPRNQLAPEVLQSGETYLLYVLADVGIPIARCLFQSP